MLNQNTKIQVIDELDLDLARSLIKAREPFPIACFQLMKKQNETQKPSFEDEENARYGYLSVPVLNFKEVEQGTTGGIKIRSKSIDLGRQQLNDFLKGLSNLSQNNPKIFAIIESIGPVFIINF